MIEKIIPGDSQEELIKQAGCLIQVYESRRHIKQAASRQFSRSDLEALAPPPGKFASHAITMGSSDFFGVNRNFDGWTDKELKERHPTFVTHGRNYREHNNKDKSAAVGEIKAAKFDPDLHRGEIVMWTDIDKAASEFERARAGEEQHGSMAATIDFDLCSCCGHKSKTASDRCDHIRYTPGAYLPEFRKYAYMDNVGSTFKDYSWVRRPADRIAHTLNYLMPLSKAASADRPLRGDELAVLYGMVDSPLKTALEKIAEFDHDHHDHPAKQAAARVVLPRAFAGEFDLQLLDKMSSHPYPGRVMRSLLTRQLVMPLASFDAYVSGRSLSVSQACPTVKEASAKLANTRMIIIQRMAGEPELGQAFGQAAEQFEPMSDCCGDIVDNMMDKVRDQFSLRYEALSKRATTNPVRIHQSAGSEISPEAFGLAALYNAYLAKTASLLPDDWMIAGQLAALR